MVKSGRLELDEIIEYARLKTAAGGSGSSGGGSGGGSDDSKINQCGEMLTCKILEKLDDGYSVEIVGKKTAAHLILDMTNTGEDLRGGQEIPALYLTERHGTVYVMDARLVEQFGDGDMFTPDNLVHLFQRDV